MLSEIGRGDVNGSMWEGRGDLADVVTSDLSRRLSTATVLFHHAVAERLGLGPADHKCSICCTRGGR